MTEGRLDDRSSSVGSISASLSDPPRLPGAASMRSRTQRLQLRLFVMAAALLLCRLNLCLIVSASRSLSPSPSSPSEQPSPSLSAAAASAPVELIDVDEIKYVVGLRKKPWKAAAAAASPSSPLSSVPFSSSPLPPAVVEMVSEAGRRFRCSLPHFASPSTLQQMQAAINTHSDSDSGTADSATASASATAAAFIAPAASASSSSPPAAAPLSSAASDPSVPPASLGGAGGRFRRALRAVCLSAAAGWWWYELCPFRSIRQFHPDGSQPAGPHGQFLSYQIRSQFSIGSYEDDDAWSWAQHGGQQAAGEWLYTQRYRGGADGRQAVVRYICPSSPLLPPTSSSASPPPSALPTPSAPASQPAAHILVAVRETATFSYELDVSTPLACYDAKQGRQRSAQQRQQQQQQRGAAVDGISASRSPLPLSSAPSASFPNASPDVALLLELLHPLQDSCLYHFAQWWTYKFCYLDALNQFHRETTQPSPQQQRQQGGVAAAVVTTAEYELGHFSHRSPSSSASSASASSASSPSPSLSSFEIVSKTRIVTGSSWEESYATQSYAAGTACEVQHRQARRVEVRFICSDQTAAAAMVAAAGAQTATATPQPAPALLSVSEVSTCEYVAVVSVPALCRHPLFSPALPTVHEIVCSPIDTTDR